MQVLESFRDLSKHNIVHICTLLTYGLRILGVPMDSHDFAMHFLDEPLSKDVTHNDDFPLLGNTEIDLGVLSSCVAR